MYQWIIPLCICIAFYNLQSVFQFIISTNLYSSSDIVRANIITPILRVRKQTWRYHSELFVATWISLSKKWKWKCIDSHQLNSWSLTGSEPSPFPLFVSLVCFLSGHQTSFFRQTKTWPYMTLTALRWRRMGPHPPLGLEYSRGRTYWPLLGHMSTLWTDSCGLGVKYCGFPGLGQVPTHVASITQTNKQNRNSQSQWRNCEERASHPNLYILHQIHCPRAESEWLHNQIFWAQVQRPSTSQHSPAMQETRCCGSLCSSQSPR